MSLFASICLRSLPTSLKLIPFLLFIILSINICDNVCESITMQYDRTHDEWHTFTTHQQEQQQQQQVSPPSTTTSLPLSTISENDESSTSLMPPIPLLWWGNATQSSSAQDLIYDKLFTTDSNNPEAATTQSTTPNTLENTNYVTINATTTVEYLPTITSTQSPCVAYESTPSSTSISGSTTSTSVPETEPIPVRRVQKSTLNWWPFKTKPYYNPRCPAASQIHPCTCKMIDLQNESNLDENDLTVPEHSIDPNRSVHPDHVETVVHCANIHKLEVMHDALRGLRGHRVNYLIIDSCHLPPFPNDWFDGAQILWTELLHMGSVQFSENFLYNKG